MPDVTSPAYWEAQDEALIKVIQPVVISAATKAARLAFDDLVLQFGAELGVSWDVVNEAAIAWAKDYTFDLVKGINATSQAFLQDEIAKWIESGEPLDALIEALAPMWGEVRAARIAVTETTRTFTEANLRAWEESGVVKGYRYNTVFDSLVCPICEPDNGKVYPLDDYENVSPRHVMCRCFETPVLSSA